MRRDATRRRSGPRDFAESVRNGSRAFNYCELNATGRRESAKHIKSDTRSRPKPEQPLDLSWELRQVCPAGGLIFSGPHLHATVPNTSGATRFSVDFRTANIDDLAAERDAPNLDAACTGTSLRELMRATDRVPVPDEVVAAYDSALPAECWSIDPTSLDPVA